MGKTYIARATGYDAVEFKAELEAPTGSGTVELPPAEEAIAFDTGAADGRRKPGIKEVQMSLAVFRTADLTPIVDNGEGETEVLVTRTDTSDRVFRGFVYPDEYEDSPLAPQPDQVELRASDGLKLLESTPFGDLAISDQKYPSIHALLTAILDPLYSSLLDLEVLMELAPEGFTDGPNTSDTYRLSEVRYPTDGLRDQRSSTREWLSQYEALEAIVTGLGVTMQQAPSHTTFFNVNGDQVRPLTWNLTHEDAVGSNGEAPLWRNTVYNGLTDVSRDLDAVRQRDDIELDHSRRRARRASKVEFLHQHGRVENVIRNGGFENRDEFWNLRSNTSGIESTIERHLNSEETPAPTDSDRLFLDIGYDAGLLTTIERVATQALEFTQPTKEAGFRFRWEAWQDQELEAFLRWEGTHSIKAFSTQVRAKALPGNPAVSVEPLDRPIMEGARLPVENQDGDVVAVVTATARAETGDGRVEVDAQSEIPKGHQILYPGFVNTTGNRLKLNKFVGPNRLSSWSSQSIHIPYVDGAGNAPSDPTPKLHLDVIADSNPDIGIARMKIDNLRLQPIQGDQILTETSLRASEPQSGEEEGFETVVGSGPTPENDRRLRGSTYYTGEHNVLERDTDEATDNFVVEGDATNETSVGEKFWVETGVFGLEVYESTDITLLASPTRTRFDVAAGINDIPATGRLYTAIDSRFSAFRWKRDPSVPDADARPLGEVLARLRMRYHRQKNFKFDITELFTEQSPRIWGTEFVTLNGRQYSVESVGALRVPGRRTLTLLEHNDYGL